MNWSEEKIIIDKGYHLKIKRNGVNIGSITNNSITPLEIYIQRFVGKMLLIISDNGRFYQIWCDKYEIKRID